jgi:cytochrome c1
MAISLSAVAVGANLNSLAESDPAEPHLFARKRIGFQVMVFPIEFIAALLQG